MDSKVPIHCRKRKLTVDVVEGCKNSVEKWVVDIYTSDVFHLDKTRET